MNEFYDLATRPAEDKDLYVEELPKFNKIVKGDVYNGPFMLRGHPPFYQDRNWMMNLYTTDVCIQNQPLINNWLEKYLDYHFKRWFIDNDIIEPKKPNKRKIDEINEENE